MLRSGRGARRLGHAVDVQALVYRAGPHREHSLLFGVATMGAAELRFLPVLGVVMLVGGAAWIVFLSLYNVAVLNLSPDWVRARVSAVWMMVFSGSSRRRQRHL